MKKYWRAGFISVFLLFHAFHEINVALSYGCIPGKRSKNEYVCKAPTSQKDAIRKSSRVFLGKVLAIEQDPQNKNFKIIKFAVSRIWKGKHQAVIVTRTHHLSSLSNGFDFSLEAEYLVYESHGLVSKCSLTTSLQNVSESDIRMLGEGQ